jgi:hypothetical protein
MKTNNILIPLLLAASTLGTLNAAEQTATAPADTQTAALKALADRSRYDDELNHARRRLSPKAFARWKTATAERREALLAHIPALVNVEGYHAERVIYEEAFRLRNGGAPTKVITKEAVFAAAKAKNLKRFLLQLATKEELLGEITYNDWGADIIPYASRRLFNAPKTGNAAAKAFADAFFSKCVGKGLVDKNYTAYFRDKIERAELQAALKLLTAEIAAVEAAHPKPEGTAAEVLADYKAALKLLLEIAQFSTPTSSTSAITDPEVEGLRRAGLRIAPAAPDKYSSLWFARQRLEFRRNAGESAESLAAAFANYYASTASRD